MHNEDNKVIQPSFSLSFYRWMTCNPFQRNRFQRSNRQKRSFLLHFRRADVVRPLAEHVIRSHDVIQIKVINHRASRRTVAMQTIISSKSVPDIMSGSCNQALLTG